MTKLMTLRSASVARTQVAFRAVVVAINATAPTMESFPAHPATATAIDVVTNRKGEPMLKLATMTLNTIPSHAPAFHPIICTTDACCMNVPFGSDSNCCKSDKDPCGIL